MTLFQERRAVSIPDFRCHALIPVIAQEASSGEVLMVAYMNEEAFRETIRTGEAHYYSRSRGRLWRKGEQSGHVQRVREIYVDCDGDALLIKVEQVGAAACHEGYSSCFFRRFDPTTGQWQTVGDRIFDPHQVDGNDPASGTSKTH